MRSVKDVFINFRNKLSPLYEVQELEAIALLTVAEITGLSTAKIKAFPETELSAMQSEKLTNTLSQLETGRPIQYILGTTEFYGLPFNVDPSVLIPRPETEELVNWIITECNIRRSTDDLQFDSPHILDIGTGSGCIAISLKKNLPAAKVYAIDISAGALATAKQNAALNDTDVEFALADILNTGSPVFDVPAPLSIIVSNPPYVTLYDKSQMHSNVTDFEPHAALFVPEDDPLIFYKAIADFAIKNLAPNGLLFFEINESLGKETVNILSHKGFVNIELKKDMSGRDRMVKASVSGSQ